MEALPGSITNPIRVVRVSSLASCCSHGSFSQSVRLTSRIAQTIFSPQQLSSVEITSVLVVVPSHRLRIMALLSFGYRATVEGLPNVHSSSTTHNSDRATSIDGNCRCRVGKVQSNFHFWSIKSYSVIPYSVFYRLPRNWVPGIFCESNPDLKLFNF